MAKVKQQLFTEPEYDYELLQEKNMKLSQMNNSKFVKKEDVEVPVLVSIANITQQDVSTENKEPEIKWVASFSDFDKPLVLNMTNIELLKSIFGDVEAHELSGRQVVLYNDKTVRYLDKVGGVRIRAPKPLAPVATATAPMTASNSNSGFNDDIPF